MPELPEVECVRRTLCPLALGRRVARVRVLRADVCECRDERGCAVAVEEARLLRGCTIGAVHRHGKQLAIESREGPALCVHLGMSGQLRATPDGEGDPASVPHTHVVWEFGEAGAGPLVFRDARRFGGVWAYPSMDALRAARWASLGPDALGADGVRLASTLGHSRRAIKAALLDQRVLAGVGNIYADEALHRSRVRPTRRCARVASAQFEAIARELRGVLREAIDGGGSTLRDYIDASGARGTQQLRHRVYGRAELPCLACGSTLRSAQVAQRTTVWCPECQR
jgi:formamidopyrimidine-DNA glycosylase